MLLFTNTPSLKAGANQTTIIDAIHSLLPGTDTLTIAVGYASKASLRELDRLVHEYHIEHTTLLIGMYYTEGMPEQMYRTALSISEKWQAEGIGEILIIKTPKYHGKMYLFHRGEHTSMIIGSANLSVLKPDATTRMQYEVGYLIEDTSEDGLIDELKKRSQNIQDVTDMSILRTLSDMLDGEPYCEHLTRKEVEAYINKEITGSSFDVKLKVPSEEQIRAGNPPFMGSNVNVCCAKARANEEIRNFYEVQIHMPSDLLRENGVLKWHPFYVVTDDGYWFKVWTTSGGVEGKQLSSAGGGDRIFGKWLKGRLIAAGLLEKPTETGDEFQGVVTTEVLERYGRNTLTFTKTTVQADNDELMSQEEWEHYSKAINSVIDKKREKLKKSGRYTTEEQFQESMVKYHKKDWLYQQEKLDVWYVSFAPEDKK